MLVQTTDRVLPDEERLDQALEVIAEINGRLDPNGLTLPRARRLLRTYARGQNLMAFGVAALAGKVDHPEEVARTTGTSIGRARDAVTTAKVMAGSGELCSALQHGTISLDQAGVIATAEDSAPGSAGDLIEVARKDGFHVLKDQARAIKLDAEQHRDLAGRQHRARSARTFTDALGMGHVHLVLEPHRYAPIAARAEAEAARLARADKRAKRARKDSGSNEAPEPFERYLANAYAALLSSSRGQHNGVRGRARRPELVVLVSHEVATRGWTDVRQGEVCKIPGIGPVAPQVAREIAGDAFLTGVFHDGTDLRHMKRWTRAIPVEVGLALELGDPPAFDGVKCVDCGNRFRTEFDHVEPHVARGPCSTTNLDPRCWSCHRAKTERDRRAGKLRAPPPGRAVIPCRALPCRTGNAKRGPRRALPRMSCRARRGSAWSAPTSPG